MFENRGVNFRVVTWIVGQTTIDTTIVVMQGLSLNEKELYKVESEIMKFCESEDVKCKPCKGPLADQALHVNKDYLADVV